MMIDFDKNKVMNLSGLIGEECVRENHMFVKIVKEDFLSRQSR